MNNQKKTLEDAEIAAIRARVDAPLDYFSGWAVEEFAVQAKHDIDALLDALADSKREIGELHIAIQKMTEKFIDVCEQRIGLTASLEIAHRQYLSEIAALQAQLLTVTNELEGERERRKTAERLSGGAWMAGAESVYVDLEKERDKLKAQLLVITGERDGERKRLARFRQSSRRNSR